MSDVKRFKMVDEKFVCDVCGREVMPLGYSARDHCPYCLCSKHVDINPGDRLSFCHGVLRPIGVDNFKGGYKIVYKCSKCGEIMRNIMAKDDNMDMIIDIMSHPEVID